MKALFVCIFSLVVLVGQAQVQDNPMLRKPAFGFGFITGTSQGLGMAVRYWPDKFGIQFSAIPVITEYSTFVSFGLTGLMMLKEGEEHDFYLSAGVHQVFTDYEITTVVGLEPSFSAKSKDGMFTAFISFGYNYWRTDYKSSPWYGGGVSHSLVPGGGLGLFYNFR